MKRVILFGLFFCGLICSHIASAQYRTVQDLLNSFSQLDMCHINTSSFLERNHKYEGLLKNEKFLDRITVNHHGSDRLAKDIARSLMNRNDWPAWIKNGVKPEDETYFASLVGVVIPGVYLYNETLIAFVPELNFKLPEAYKFKDAFCVFAPSDYYYDRFNPRGDDSTRVLQENVNRWVKQLDAKPYVKPIVLDTKYNIFHSFYSANSESNTENYIYPSSIDYLDAALLAKKTSVNPKWMERASYAKNLPEGLAYLSMEDMKTLKAYVLHSEIKGYTYTREKDAFRVMKTVYIRIPANENKHLAHKVAWAPGRDVFFKFTGHYPPSHPFLRGELFDSTKLKRFDNNYTEYLLPLSREGKIANLLRDYLNGYKNIGKGYAPVENGTSNVRQVYWFDQLSDFGKDFVIRDNNTKKIIYSSSLTPMGEQAWTYEQCKEYSSAMYYLLTRTDFFWGMDGFSSLRKPKVQYSFERAFTGNEGKKLGVFVTEYTIAGTLNYETQYAYDQELAYKYTYSLRLRISIREDEKMPGRYYVLFVMFDNK